MHTGTPHMRNFLDPRTFTYGDFPYAYGDQFLTCQRSFLETRVNQNFHVRRAMNQNFVNAQHHAHATSKTDRMT